MNKFAPIIIIIIIAHIYNAPNTTFLGAEHIITRSSDSGLPAHKVCTFSTPWGAFQPVAILQAPLANQTTLAFASYRVPILTPGWRVANVDQCLAKGH